jgi:hypothetical protein
LCVIKPIAAWPEWGRVLKYRGMPMFTREEIIVRDDLKYPEGAVVVDGIDERGHLLVHPLGAGLQFSGAAP